ncbi:hypothetical protein LYZ81_18210, partial [Xanthomonas hortorum]|nr:hypothetical protein [Xanthomonas hortorum]
MTPRKTELAATALQSHRSPLTLLRKRLPNTSCLMFRILLCAGNVPRRYPAPRGWKQEILALCHSTP